MNHSNGRLLIVDDNETNIELLCRRLERQGYTTAAATGGEQALALVKAEAFDVVLLDIMMPDIDGLTVLKTLRQTYSASELPVIMATAKSDSEDIVMALSLGANDYITKPIDFPVVLARLRAQLSRKQAEAALRESEERFALAVRGSNDGLWDWRLTTNDIYFSPRWKAMLGLNQTTGENKTDTWFTLVHPEDRPQLQAAITAHCQGTVLHFSHEHRMLHADGTYRWMHCRGALVRNERGEAYRMAGSLTDITERKIADGLTGLPNRLLFVDRLGQTMQRATRTPDYLFAVLSLELDRFTIINASLGPVAGDRLLIAATQRLRQCLRAGDTVTHLDAGYTIARFKSDGFVILVDNITTASDAIRVTERLQKVLAMPFTLDEHEVHTTVSVGIALSSAAYECPDDYLRDADIAMHRAKVRGLGSYEVFDTSMHAAAVARLQLERELRNSVEEQRFRLYYQPIVSLRTGKIRGFEALVRWQHPTRGLVSPEEFIPLAEETGVIFPLGTWVFQEACRQMHSWQQQCAATPPLFISINLAVKQLEQPDLVVQLNRILQETGLTPQSVKLEITESSLMENTSTTAAMITQLRDLGTQISLDDFGTGYSSMSYLHSFPINTLKIDRAFISRMCTDTQSAAIVRTILALAHHLGMDVVAEGVEFAQQFLDLRTLGCEYAQGYFVSKPLDSQAAEALLAADPQW